ncbi:MAG TPA: permease, partial [Guyparkeria sp.]|nr:permease [Guyparkeria sp.]
IYVLAALLVSLAAGWLLQELGFERQVRREASREAGEDECCGASPAIHCDSNPATSSCETSSCGSAPVQSSCDVAGAMSAQCGGNIAAESTSRKGRYSGLWQEAWSDFLEVLPYLLIGIAIGSLIYGYMPTGLLEQYAGPDNPFAIPIAAVIGVPLYIRAEAVIPLAAALMAKGIGAGTVLALIVGSAGASLTELILLRSLFTLKLLAAFVTVIFAMAMIAGYVTFLFF